jgi:CHAT domain-containing protein
LRNGLYAEELKISFMKDRVRVYEALVALGLGRHNLGTAAEIFNLMQQAKSRSLVDMLSSAGTVSGFSPGVQGKPGARVQQLREELNWYFHKIEASSLKGAPREEIARLRLDSQQRERELLSLLREQGVSADSEAVTRPADPLSAEHVRSVIPADTVILEYFQARDQIVVALLDRNCLKIVPLTRFSRIVAPLNLLQFQLGKVLLGSQYLSSFADTLLQATHSHLKDLYRELFAPLLPLLRGNHLVIAPCGRLHQLPFHALANGTRYLLDDFTISYAPSASVYAFCRRHGGSRTSSSLVMGVPDSRAPFVAEEVEAVTRWLPGASPFVGAHATAAVLREKGPSSRFIHIATHGSFRRDNPMFSAIRLGDSYLTLLDLYHLKLSAELVTLSGCSTALSVVAAGDELLGLARGLIQAGAESSLLTLWDVQDRSTARFMGRFYENLGRGLKKSEALSLAMQELRVEYPHPYYWAPFILVGNA